MAAGRNFGVWTADQDKGIIFLWTRHGDIFQKRMGNVIIWICVNPVMTDGFVHFKFRLK